MEIVISTPHIRLDQLLKLAGVVQTGGEAKHRIQNGYVEVDGLEERRRGKKIWPGSTVAMQGLDEPLKVVSSSDVG